MDKEYQFESVSKSYKLRSANEYVKSGQDFVWYGEDNMFPQHTIDLYENSATHNALVNSISSWIYGGGLTATNKENNPEEWLKFEKLISSKIGKNDVQLMCSDLKLHGGFYISFTYSIDRTTITDVSILPYETMRVEVANEDGDCEFYYYSQNWQDGRRANVSKLKAYNPTMKDTYPTQVLFAKMSCVGSYYYPKPDYIGAWNYIELDKNVSQFHLSNIENGLAPSFIINFANGIPSTEKRQQIKQEIERELSGSENAGKFLCTFSPDKTTTPDITPVQLSDADKQYQFLSEEITKKVMISHRVVSPRLFGVIDSAGLGNNAEELQTASELFEQTIIEPFRKIILDSLNLIMMEGGINLNLKFEPFNLFNDEFADTKEEVVEEEIINDVIPQGVEEEVTEEEVEKVEASYNGAQISSAIDIIAKVQEGVLTQAQAIVFLIQFLQLPEEVAKGFFSDGVEESLSNLQLAKKKDKKKRKKYKYKTLDEIDTKPTKEMMREAQLGLDLRKEFGRGGTEVGVARARDISNGKNLSIETIKRMFSFFSRHEKSVKNGKGFNKGDEGYPSAGKIAWLLWGGESGFDWAKRKVEEIERVEELANVKTDMTDDLADYLFEELEKVGEIINEEDWILKETIAVNTKADAMKFQRIAMATNKNEIKRESKPQDKSDQDVGLYKIRYRYSQNISKGSRNFCMKMVDLSKRKFVFRFEDIQKMEELQFNSQFAPKGESSYSIWDWKGGCFCHHKWEMQVFVRARAKGERFDPKTGKTIRKGGILPKSQTKDLENDQKESVEKARNKGVNIPNMGQGDVRPIDTPTRGKLN